MHGCSVTSKAGRHAWLGTQILGYVTGEPAYYVTRQLAQKFISAARI